MALVDPVKSHVNSAREAGTFEALVGDARELSFADDSLDALLMAGPLYHLADRADRVAPPLCPFTEHGPTELESWASGSEATLRPRSRPPARTRPVHTATEPTTPTSAPDERCGQGFSSTSDGITVA